MIYPRYDCKVTFYRKRKELMTYHLYGTISELNRYDSIHPDFDYLQNEVEFNLDHEEFEKAEENSRKLIELCESVLLHNS